MNFGLIHATVVIDEGAAVATGTRIWHFSHIMAGAVIGKDCNIGQNVVICTGAIVGDRVKIQNNVSIYTGVTCHDDVFIGPSVVFTNVINPRSEYPRKHEYRNTIIERGASIGANSTIICGLTIGSYAMIGAGSVVTKHVKAFSLVVGNPARQVGWVSEYGNKLVFDKSGAALCPHTGQQYRHEEGVVSRVK